ncbi:MAG: formate dehydrogenase accessory sulfurtransferase FdhD [Clostridiales bacterium]|nr:formate dehydrogenase accessory sulfurtransferase FdhD [Clostridiales bacterium]
MFDKRIIHKYTHNAFQEQEDSVIREFRLNLFLNGAYYISLMCLPQHLHELALGFLFSEGRIRSLSDVIRIGPNPPSGDEVYVVIRDSARLAVPERRTVTSGFAGGSVNQAFFQSESLPEIPCRRQVSGEALIRMMDVFSRQSALFQDTGAVHSCKLILPDSTALFYEDIGRHNALDKIVGKALLDALDTKDGILLTSGRISSEMLIKAAGMGIPILVSISAPTSKAVEIAEKIHMTLIGFARGSRFNVYAGADRVL